MDLTSLPLEFSYTTALEHGLSRADLRAALSQGAAHRLHRGWYARAIPAPDPTTVETWERRRADHLERCRHAVQRFPGCVLSHTSAAVLHGLELMVAPGAEAEITVVDRVPRSRREQGLVVHHCDSGPNPWTEVEGMRVTTLPRTVADVLRSRRPPHGVAMLDAALRDHLVTVQDVRRELRLQHRWTGRPRALLSLELADPRRESWLESFSFVALAELQIPLPLAQVSIFDAQRSFVGRVDGLLPEHRVFLEADGLAKYFLAAVEGEVSAEASAATALTAERRRHRRLESLGLSGVRWGSAEIMTSPSTVADRVASAIDRGAQREVNGWVEWGGVLRRLPFTPASEAA